MYVFYNDCIDHTEKISFPNTESTLKKARTAKFRFILLREKFFLL
jgi:hypothetical protein